jgi:hypothetical protein
MEKAGQRLHTSAGRNSVEACVFTVHFTLTEGKRWKGKYFHRFNLKYLTF